MNKILIFKIYKSTELFTKTIETGGKIMTINKRIAMFRHGMGDGDLLSLSCQKNIKDHGIPGINELVPDAHRIVLHLGNGFKKSRQTMKCYQHWLIKNGHGSKIANFYIPIFKRLGSPAMFKKMNENIDFKEMVPKKGYLYSFLYATTDAYRDHLRLNILRVLIRIFDCYLSNGDLCISIGHSPIIELAGNEIDKEMVKEDFALQELEGLVIRYDGNELFLDNVYQELL